MYNLHLNYPIFFLSPDLFCEGVELGGMFSDSESSSAEEPGKMGTL